VQHILASAFRSFPDTKRDSLHYPSLSAIVDDFIDRMISYAFSIMPLRNVRVATHCASPLLGSFYNHVIAGFGRRHFRTYTLEKVTLEPPQLWLSVMTR